MATRCFRISGQKRIGWIAVIAAVGGLVAGLLSTNVSWGNPDRSRSIKPSRHISATQPTPAQLRQWGVSLRVDPEGVRISEARALRLTLSHLPFKMHAYRLEAAKPVIFEHVPNVSAPAWFLVYRNVSAVNGPSNHRHSMFYRWMAVFIDGTNGQVLEILTAPT